MECILFLTLTYSIVKYNVNITGGGIVLLKKEMYMYNLTSGNIRNYDSSSYIGIDPGREYHF